jgi:8-oxo-dGTP pyrophosphatase MutT (NUDIX family)
MKSVEELKNYVTSLANPPTKFRIAVGSMIFTPDDKVILLERSAGARDSAGYLEGVGGGVDNDEHDLHAALRREIKEEIGNVDVSVDDMLGVKILPGEDYPFYVVVDFLCRLVRGVPKNMEPHKCKAIHLFEIRDIPRDKLSNYQRVADKTYRKKYGDRPFYL